MYGMLLSIIELLIQHNRGEIAHKCFCLFPKGHAFKITFKALMFDPTTLYRKITLKRVFLLANSFIHLFHIIQKVLWSVYGKG